METATPTQAAEQNASATEPRVQPTTVPTTVILFDRFNKFQRAILNPDSIDGKKRCTVRFPTDDEWCSRAKQTVSVRKNLDAGRAKTETPREAEINLNLFNRIRLDQDGSVFDEAEATLVIDRLENCMPFSCERVGVVYTIKMRTFNNCEVTHELRMPSQKQIMDFGRSTIQITSMRQTIETRIALEPVRDLWHKLKVSVSGYALDPTTGSPADSMVPIVHMSAAINELLAQVNADSEAMDRDPEL